MKPITLAEKLRSLAGGGRRLAPQRYRGRNLLLEKLEVRQVLATFAVTNSQGFGPNSFIEAVQQANANPGPDIIQFSPGLTVDVTLNSPVGNDQVYYFISQITDSVTIEGNGSTIVGHNQWITSDGQLNSTDHCPAGQDGTIITTSNPGFVRVGTRGQSNAGLSVVVRNLDFKGLSSIAEVDQDAHLEIDGSRVSEIYPVRDCDTPAIVVRAGGSLTLKDNHWKFLNNWGQTFVTTVWSSSIVGASAGDLNISNSTFKFIDTERGLVDWKGAAASSVNIVSSEFFAAGGIQVSGASTTNIVNSIWGTKNFGVPQFSERIINQSTGPMNIVASTFYHNSLECDRHCQGEESSYGTFLVWAGAAPINFDGTAIGLNFSQASIPRPLLDNFSHNAAAGGSFTAKNTWIQESNSHTETQLKAITGTTGTVQLLVGPQGLPTLQNGDSISRATPLLGTSGDPGKLLDVIDDAGPGGANELRSPITGAPITNDVFGNPRVDANGRRNIGAVQLSLSTQLKLVGTGTGEVELSWTRPMDPSSGAITGYGVLYRPSGSSVPYARVNVSGASATSGKVSGLVNGIEYEFQVVAVNVVGDSPTSNLVVATPFGQIGTPVITAQRGSQEVKLFWTEPDAGGHPGLLTYSVVYREKGSLQWLPGPSRISARTTTIPGLMNGKEYEFGVFAQSTDGAFGNLGTTTAIPLDSLPACDIATQNIPGDSGTAQIRSDADRVGGSALIVTGTNRNDTIIIEPRPLNRSQVRVKETGRLLGIFSNASFERIVAFGLAGNDTIIVDPRLVQPAIIFGGDGNDLLFGGGGDDQLDGGNGNDTLYARAGDDQLCGGVGADRLFGGVGDDTLFGDADNDYLYGESGNDVILGGDGTDFLYGGVGDDQLFGEAGDDWLFGDAGNDILVGGNGNDYLYGHSGRDLLIGGNGADQLFGGTDDDILISGPTTYDESRVALTAILTEWKSSNSYSARVRNIRSGGGANGVFKLDNTTVIDDGEVDTLFGESHQDWFLVGLNDKIKDRCSNELVN